MNRWTYSGLGYRRRVTRSVPVGAVLIGSEHPIRVQSMTTPSTKDTLATVDQIERLADVGCEIARVTVPTNADADALPAIRAELTRRKIEIPLVADIHFTPRAAMKAVEHVEKVRINPGNFADKKKFAVLEYTDTEYAAELERIGEIFLPLVRRSKELGVSMRIGTNHGSLSDRIMNRYGDTPEGMVESALEFVRICEAESYHDLILSMKSSNPVVVQQVYRLLAERMDKEGMDYPFHLGVTEAGDGEDGRVKSALGIGALLAEGIGDTIRVSLTEDPVAEIPVARRLAERYNRWHESGAPAEINRNAEMVEARDPHLYQRRESGAIRIGRSAIGNGESVIVEVPLNVSLDQPRALREELDRQCGVRVPEETRAELVSVDALDDDGATLEALEALRGSLELVAPNVLLSVRIDLARMLNLKTAELDRWAAAVHRLHLVLPTALSVSDLSTLAAHAATKKTALLFEGSELQTLVALATEYAASCEVAVAVQPHSQRVPLFEVRALAQRLLDAELKTPLILIDRPHAREDDPLLGPATMLGGLLCDGIGDAVQLDLNDATRSRQAAFGILQAARVRITKTEFISCPSCGRTLFDLEETTARIKSRTTHLKGVKIAVMGCIVNGPGEMADADFGYVGWGEDKIALFVGKDMVTKDVPTGEADQRLIDLIKEHGRWVEPPVAVLDEA